MSRLYERSIQKEKYFEQQYSFNKSLSRFSINTNTLFKPDKYNKNIPFVGLGGVPLSSEGDIADSVYVDSADSHTLIIGPTGSKKSRLIAMPTVRMLGVSNESMIICDPKAEIYERTADHLNQNGYEIHVLNLRNPNYGAGWNILSIAYEFYLNGDIDRAYEFTNDVVTNVALMDVSEKDPFWDHSSASLLLGLIMLLFKYCKEHKLSDSAVNIGNLIELRKQLFSNTFKESGIYFNNDLWEYACTDGFIETALIGTFSALNVTRQCILSVFDQKTRIFTTQPNLTKMLSNSTFKFENICKKPTAIFLILPDEKTSLHGLVSLFVKQSYEYIIYDLQKSDKTEKILRLNYMLDEFSSLPTIKDFPAMITAARSRNIRFNIIIQSKHQLLLRYKEDADTIQSNCNNLIFLTSRELSLLAEISSLGGDIDENNRFKPVLPVSELQKLDKDTGEALILRGRLKPYITKLPDIEVYDQKKYKEIPYNKRNDIDMQFLKFNLMSKAKFTTQNKALGFVSSGAKKNQITSIKNWLLMGLGLCYIPLIVDRLWIRIPGWLLAVITIYGIICVLVYIGLYVRNWYRSLGL